MSQEKTSDWLNDNVKKAQFTRKSIHEKLKEKEISDINKEETTIGELTGQVDTPETETIPDEDESINEIIQLPKPENKEPLQKKKKGKKRLKIGLTGGGTGGHIFPLVSLYNYLQEEDIYDFVWVGQEEGLEYDICMEKGIEFIDIPAGKLRRYFDPRNFFEPLKNLTGIFFGMYFIIKYKIDIIFSKGGYVALPICIAAFILRKKIYVHESDTVSGITNRLIAKMAHKVFYTFPNEYTTEENTKHIHTGQIMNGELIDGIKDLTLRENKKLEILLIGGSQGSRRIYEAMVKLLPDFPSINFTVILGEKNLEFRNDFQHFQNVTIHDFVTQSELGEIYKHTDIAVTRAGATSLFELMSFGIHAIIVPLTESAGNHQWENAKYFQKTYGSDIIDENKELEIHLYRKLRAYTNLRKAGLNLDKFFTASQIIDKELGTHI